MYYILTFVMLFLNWTQILYLLCHFGQAQTRPLTVCIRTAANGREQRVTTAHDRSVPASAVWQWAVYINDNRQNSLLVSAFLDL